MYNEGISKAGDVIDLGVNNGIIKKSGAWFTYGEDRFQGREQLRQKLMELTELYEKLSLEVKQKLGMIKEAPATAEQQPAVKEKKK